MVGEGKAYKAGMLILNTNAYKTVYAQESALNYAEENFDGYEIFAQYLQEHCGLYKTGKTNEEELGMHTVRTRDAKRKKTEKEKFADVNASGMLARVYYFRQVVIRKDTGQILSYASGNTNNLKTGIDRLKSRLRSSFINPMIPFEAFWFTQEGGAIHCTAGWESETCQRLMGYAIRNN
jgi:hypothetical protein